MDVLRLANHFLKYFARQANKPIDRFDEAVASKLLAYDWPGNVRELRNVIERAVVLSRHNEITLDAIPPKIVDYKSNLLILSDQDNQPLAPLDEIQRRYIRYVLDRTSGNKTETAKILGLDRKTLYRKLKEEDVN
jgi:two-component system response regulator HydG